MSTTTDRTCELLPNDCARRYSHTVAKHQQRSLSVFPGRNMLLFAGLAIVQCLPAGAAPITTVTASANANIQEFPIFTAVNLEHAGLEMLDRVGKAVESDVFTVPETDTATMILLGLLLCGGGILLKKRFQPATELESGIPGDNTSADSPFRLER